MRSPLWGRPRAGASRLLAGLVLPLCLMPQPAHAVAWWWDVYQQDSNEQSGINDPTQGSNTIPTLDNPIPAGAPAGFQSNGLPAPSRNYAVRPPTIINGDGAYGVIRQVSAGDYHSLLLKQDGTVQATGDNTYGQLGTNNRTTMLTRWTTVAQGMRKVAACSYFSMAVSFPGQLFETGDNYWGEQGNGVIGPSVNAWHIASRQGASGNILPMDQVIHVACGEQHAAAIRADGTLWMAGGNNYGQTGAGGANTGGYWQQVPINFTPVTLAAGAFSTLVIDSNQQLWVAGDDQFWEIGVNGQQATRFTQVMTGQQVLNVAGGYQHSLALLANGHLAVTGQNAVGQLGTGDNAPRTGWTEVTVRGSPTQVAARDNQSFFIGGQGLYVTGDNQLGQLGLPVSTRNTANWTPAASTAAIVSPGQRHVLLIDAGTRQVWTAGDNSYGQLGSAYPDHTLTPCPWGVTAR